MYIYIHIRIYIGRDSKGGRRKAEGERGAISINLLHGIIARVVGPAKLVGSALVRGSAGGTIAKGTGDSSVGRDACEQTHTMEEYMYIHVYMCA